MRVFHQKDASEAKKYYAASDYYESGPENLRGLWLGKGADKLGLHGYVDQTHFDRLCENMHPDEDRRLTQRNLANRRVLTDITFSTPKSVSILYAATEDTRIIDAVQQAVSETFADLEQDALTRVNTARGVISTRNTGNLTAASWVHLTSRPVDDPEFGPHADPQIHTHIATLNATFDGNRWTAVDLSDIVRDSGVYESAFQSRLAHKLQALGLPIERTQHNFEIKGVSRETIENFSRRTAHINDLIEQGVHKKIAMQEGISLEAAKGLLGARSREKKNDLYSIEELPNIWQQRMTDDEKSYLQRLMTRGASQDKSNPDHAAAQAVDYAIEHQFSKDSVVRERRVLRDAIQYGIGSATVDEIREELNKRDLIREGSGASALITTPEVLAEEQDLLAFTRSGRGSMQPLAPNHVIERQWLSDEQKAAVLGLLQSSDRLQIVRGVAGSGKTTLMTEAIEGIEKTGTDVTVLAPTATAAKQVLEELEGETLAMFLKDKEMQAAAAGGVIWLDEAGQAGMQDIAKLAKLSKSLNARIILSGDKRQHKSVARGSPLKLLETQAGIKPIEVNRIRRQSGKYREAIENLSRGDVLEGFNQLDDLEFVHELSSDEERYQTMARDYADAVESGKETLVIAPTHAERAIVNDAIRTEMKARGHIHSDDHHLSILKSKRLSDAQRSDAINYQPGDVVEFVTRGKGGFNAGDRLRVIERRDGQVIADSAKGIVQVPLASPNSFDVYRWHDAEFAVGDTIRITKNVRKEKLFNGTVARIDGFTDAGMLKLSNGRMVHPDWGHIDHGVVLTSHSSQGKSYKRVLVAQSSLSFPASNAEQIYVSASRGKEKVDIYTDDLEGLRHAIQRSQPTPMASELAAAKLRQRTRQLQREATQRTNRLHQMHESLQAHHHHEMGLP